MSAGGLLASVGGLARFGALETARPPRLPAQTRPKARQRSQAASRAEVDRIHRLRMMYVYHTYIHPSIHPYIHTYLHTCIYFCIYIYIERERKKERCITYMYAQGKPRGRKGSRPSRPSRPSGRLASQPASEHVLD